MAACTFFGHRNTPEDIKNKLYTVLKELIEKEGVDTYFIGNQGSFDYMAKEVLKSLKTEYPNINYNVVIPYLPLKKDLHIDYSDTIFPEELSGVHPKWAIDKRNRYMISKSDFVITYVVNTYGGAYKFKVLAEKKGLRVINIAEL